MNGHHRRAVRVLAATALADLFLGSVQSMAENIPLWHGLYCATATATSVGCDTAPPNAWGYLLSALEMLTILPLFAAVFSFFTTGLTADHIDTRHEELKHGAERLRRGSCATEVLCGEAGRHDGRVTAGELQRSRGG